MRITSKINKLKRYGGGIILTALPGRRKSMMGYLVDLKEKSGLFDTEGECKKVLMTREALSGCLLKPSEYYIFSAVSVDIEEYQANYSKF